MAEGDDEEGVDELPCVVRLSKLAFMKTTLLCILYDLFRTGLSGTGTAQPNSPPPAQKIQSLGNARVRISPDDEW